MNWVEYKTAFLNAYARNLLELQSAPLLSETLDKDPSLKLKHQIIHNDYIKLFGKDAYIKFFGKYAYARNQLELQAALLSPPRTFEEAISLKLQDQTLDKDYIELFGKDACIELFGKQAELLSPPPRNLEEETNVELKGETLPNNYIELFGKSPKVEKLCLLDCTAYQSLDFRHFTHLREFYIKIHLDISNPIEINLPEMADTKQMMYRTENTIVLTNMGESACLPMDKTLCKITRIKLINMEIDAKFVFLVNRLPRLHSLEMIRCHSKLSSVDLEFLNSRYFIYLGIIDCSYHATVSISLERQNMLQFKALLKHGYIIGRKIVVKGIPHALSDITKSRQGFF